MFRLHSFVLRAWCPEGRYHSMVLSLPPSAVAVQFFSLHAREFLVLGARKVNLTGAAMPRSYTGAALLKQSRPLKVYWMKTCRSKHNGSKGNARRSWAGCCYCAALLPGQLTADAHLQHFRATGALFNRSGTLHSALAHEGLAGS
jgi:hypothetical protein